MNLLFLNKENLFSGYDKSLGNGAIAAITTMLLVFLILALIVVISFGVGKIIDKASKKTKTAKPQVKEETQTKTPLDLNDEDAIVASLVASIDYRAKTKKDIRVVSIKEIK